MALKTLIVSAANEAYFPLLQDLVHSIRAVLPEIDIGILDIGLNARQCQELSPQVTAIEKAIWNIQIPDALCDQSHLKGFTVRPFLAEYFPGYDVYIWMDADVWVQSADAIDLFIRAASQGALGAVAHTDRAYMRPQSIKQWTHKRMAACFGVEQADEVLQHKYINAGIFSLPANAPHWKIWAQLFQQAADHSGIVCDQVSLNYAVRSQSLALELLPASCNWLCHLAIPKWDQERKLLCEPCLPNQALSIIHMTADTQDQHYAVQCLDDSVIHSGLRRSDLLD